jgi:SAM-dependent methyltransferase
VNLEPLRPTERFGDRVVDYNRYRPGYPAGIVPWVAAEIGFNADWRVADVGAGTGRLTGLFLMNGNCVVAVEPNAPMRRAAERNLLEYPKFHSLAGKAEATRLSSSSIDLITVGQAFHWFDPHATRREFARVLVPPGWVLLVWNRRLAAGSPFLDGYEAVLARHCPEYQRVTHRTDGNAGLDVLYGAGGYRTHTFPNRQRLNWEGLRGRALSSSYVPTSGRAYEQFTRALTDLYAATAQDDGVEMVYVTELYLGRVAI